MRVLYLNPTVAVGGAEKSMLELISGVDPDLVESVAACISEGPLPDALRRAGAEVIINPWPSFALRIGRGSALSKTMLPLAAVAATFPNLPPGRLQVVYNGLDTDLYSPGIPSPEVRSSLGLEPGNFVIGALAPLKGHIQIIRAAPRILEKIPNARILIVGQEMYQTLGHEGYRGVLEEEIRRLGVQGRVILAGHRDDPVAVMRNLDVLVHASVYPESFGRVLAEAMACGVPVIATALGGPTEILASEEQGVLIPAGDPAAIAEAVIRLHRDPEQREKMGTAGRERVVNAFSVERYVREVEAIYRDLVA